MFKFNDHHAKTDCKGQKVGDRSCIKYAHNAEKMWQCNDKWQQEQNLSGQGKESSLVRFSDGTETLRRSAAKSLTR